MTPESGRKRSPATNREYFRFVVRFTLSAGAAVFVVFLMAHLFWARARLRSGDVLTYLALSGVTGLGLTLWRLRWLKWRDSQK